MLKQPNEDIQQDKNETTIKTYIQIVAKEFHQLQQQMSTAITRIEQLEEEVEALKRFNEQLKRTTGPKIGKIYERLDALEHKPDIQAKERKLLQLQQEHRPHHKIHKRIKKTVTHER